MSISGISSSNYVAPSSLTQGVQSSQANGTQDTDAGRVHKSHHGHGGGQMQNAMMQAMQSLGMTPPQSGSSATATSTTDSDGDSDGSTSATSSVKKDMGKLMHALFQAVKGESTSGTSSTTGASQDPSASFAAGLSALISQVSNGSAPAGLQSAFDKVAADLQSGSSAATGSSTAATSSTSSQATLQTLLSKLQQNLGYGASSSSAALGNLLSTQA